MGDRLRHVAILDPGTRVPELDCFNRMARTSPIRLSYHLPAMQGTESLWRATDGVAGVVILGSGASVHDDEPWQRDLDDWLLPQLEEGVPVLGLCYGHQHLAHRLGGDIGFVFEDERKIKGVRRISLDADRLWGDARQGTVVVSHRETVTRLPEGFVGLGATRDVAIEAFGHPHRPIWGLQCHPEATTAFTDNNDVPFGEDPSILSFGHGLVDAFLALAARSLSRG